MKNKILVIPKYALKFDNGFTPVDSSYNLSYNTNLLYRDPASDSKLFYRIVPYLIVECNGHYLVFKSNDRYSFNINGIIYIKDRILYQDPISTIVKYNAGKCGVTDAKDINCVGFIKSIRSNPDDIAIVYVAKTKESFEAPEDAKWMTMNDLVNKCRKFDSFGIEYIDYLISKRIKK